MFASITSAPWKIATIGAAIVALIVGVMLFLSYRDNNSLQMQKQELVNRIEDPKTGYVARLTQANANVVTLRNAIQEQNTQLEQRKTEATTSRVELNRLRKELAAAQRESADMRERLRQFMATKPQGSTLEARVRDIDGRILKELAR